MNFNQLTKTLLRIGHHNVFGPIKIVQYPISSAVQRVSSFSRLRILCSSCTRQELLSRTDLNRTSHHLLSNFVTDPKDLDSEVTVRGNNVPKPCHSFDGTEFKGSIMDSLTKNGFTKPTVIQAYGLPIALSGRDLVGIGQTGSGKTLAYLLPALVHIAQQRGVKNNNEPTVLVLAPTRELAQQINEVGEQFGRSCGTRTACLYGGAAKGPQIGALRSGVDICIGTPGRIIDLLQMEVLRFSNISYLVLDEADRMLDMGFEPQIREIINQIPGKHQTLMWSATWPKDVRELAEDFLKDSVQINVGSTELRANPNIKQVIEVCSPYDKESRLLEVLKEVFSNKEGKVLLFAQTKLQVDQIAKTLNWKQIKCSSIHGDKGQMQRDQALYEFKTNRTRVLVATDVAARGLDVTDITDVINYDFPNDTETYVHRIGRTARGENSGRSYTFFTRSNAGHARALIKVLQKAHQQVNPELLKLVEEPFRKPLRSSYSSSRNSFKRNSAISDFFEQYDSHKERSNFQRGDLQRGNFQRGDLQRGNFQRGDRKSSNEEGRDFRSTDFQKDDFQRDDYQRGDRSFSNDGKGNYRRNENRKPLRRNDFDEDDLY